MNAKPLSLFWMRRDLRFEDNTALHHAIHSGYPVQPVFIFDTNILGNLEDKHDARVTFIYQTVADLKDQLKIAGGDLWVFHGKPEEVFTEIMEKEKVHAVYTNKDYEPYAIHRDKNVTDLCTAMGVGFFAYKDHVIFDTHEVVKDDKKPYTVFTPYKKKWLSRFAKNPPQPYPSNISVLTGCLYKHPTSNPLPLMESLGFSPSKIKIPPRQVSRNLIAQYDKNRDFPAMDATSKLGIHFRFGTISIRQKVLAAATLNETYLSELIWRDFYSMILWHFPHVAKGAFRPEYDKIEWVNDSNMFDAWCHGKTGYPLVDAGMRQLLTTGYMHNRVRMVVASFLTKHLLIDWRWGEAWFARYLLDFDLASNNGGWQWAAGSGTDAAPYFRIFNPTAQVEKFDKNMAYIRYWVPEFGTSAYPAPIVDHKTARELCLSTYAAALSSK